jgi:hypothetical protein
LIACDWLKGIDGILSGAMPMRPETHIEQIYVSRSSNTLEATLGRRS